MNEYSREKPSAVTHTRTFKALGPVVWNVLHIKPCTPYPYIGSSERN